ncbi:hypothetical protein PQ465_12815 [Sphingobacterium oryzagri]|uniref:XRE family transcriptional regulator n=1 Tax=Sphingobacterium oryzagri TaxID=3025669 RepID=A0ABY7WBZ9_9SPHI|nr:hypothetical protein [Sphingobacterium sp. KACC 22765]WDF67186.1 hypothetical protein PQ465_12815 [Sphingobacterium sp. KACC 22765]
MSKKYAIDEFVEILQYYMDYYGLYNVDIRNLLNSTTDIVNDLRSGKNGPTLNKAASIAKIFGLQYYEFGNPNFPLPGIDNLPVATQEKIAWRKEVGPPTSKRYNKLDLNQVVLNVLTAFAETDEFLPSDVYKMLPEDMKDKLGSATRITGLFSNELLGTVVKTGNKLVKEGPGRPEEYYRLAKSKGK